MSEEVDALRAEVSQQGLVLEGLQRAAADAEERQKSDHAELPEMMAQMESGKQEAPFAAVVAGRDAATTPASGPPDVGAGSRGGGQVPAEAGLGWDRLGGRGGRGPDWGYSPRGEQPSNPPD